MSNPVKHHYVAQHVLRRFCDANGVLWTYDKEKNKIYPGRPRDQASGKHFYSFKGRDGTKTTVIELKFLGPIDKAGCIAIERLFRRETLTDEQWIDFMRFASAQMIRVESYFQRLDASLTPLLDESARRMFKYDPEFKKRLTKDLRDSGTSEKDIEGLLASLARGEFKLKANRGYIVSIFLKSLDQITKDFCRMEWDVVDTKDTDEVFLLSDNPLVLTDIGEGPPKPLGTRNPDIEVTMPLRPTTVAVGGWGKGVGYGTIDTDYISVINQRTIEQAHRYVYAPYRSDELLAKVVASQGRQVRTRVTRIKQGEATIIVPVFGNCGAEEAPAAAEPTSHVDPPAAV